MGTMKITNIITGNLISSFQAIYLWSQRTTASDSPDNSEPNPSKDFSCDIQKPEPKEQKSDTSNESDDITERRRIIDEFFNVMNKHISGDAIPNEDLTMTFDENFRYLLEKFIEALPLVNWEKQRIINLSTLFPFIFHLKCFDEWKKSYNSDVTSVLQNLYETVFVSA